MSRRDGSKSVPLLTKRLRWSFLLSSPVKILQPIVSAKIKLINVEFHTLLLPVSRYLVTLPWILGLVHQIGLYTFPTALMTITVSPVMLIRIRSYWWWITSLDISPNIYRWWWLCFCEWDLNLCSWKRASWVSQCHHQRWWDIWGLWIVCVITGRWTWRCSCEGYYLYPWW